MDFEIQIINEMIFKFEINLSNGWQLTQIFLKSYYIFDRITFQRSTNALTKVIMKQTEEKLKQR